MARFLLTTFGSLGDLFPFLALGQGLQARGHAVCVATTPDYRDVVTAADLAFAPVGPAIEEFGDPAEVTQRVNDLRHGSEYVIREMFMPHLHRAYEETTAAADDMDLIVTQQLALTAPMVAAKRAIPWVSTALTSLTFSSRMDPPVFPPAPWLRRVHNLSPWLYHQAYGLMGRMIASWSEPLRAFRAELGLPALDKDPLLEGQFSPYLTLALFSTLLSPPQADWPDHVLPCGFLFYQQPGNHSAVRAQVDAFMRADAVQTQGAPIIFALGSMAVLAAADFYVESIQAARQLGRPAIIVTGRDPRNLPSHLLGDDVLALDYAPYDLIFPHAAVSVHQGGIGTLAQALITGNPTLVVPFSHDQPDNARRAAVLGVGAQLARKDYRAATVARRLRPLLEDATIRARAADVGRQLRAEDGLATACAALEELV